MRLCLLFQVCVDCSPDKRGRWRSCFLGESLELFDLFVREPDVSALHVPLYTPLGR